MTAPENILFAGIGTSPQCWYRCSLPARALGADWVGMRGEPPALLFPTGETRRPVTGVADFCTYEIVVLQQPRGKAWLQAIRQLQAAGVTVLFEVDDYVHGVRSAKDHSRADRFGKPVLDALELTMRACDGIICSTDYIASRYRTFNRNVWVCHNGLDLGRYALTRGERDSVTIGWAGGTAHRPALTPWLPAVAAVMDAHPQTRFMSVGVPAYAEPFAKRYGAARATGVPWAPLESYPAAMASFDIALAPATNSSLFRGKSDLRWLEASALGIPLVADPLVYSAIEDGVTGLLATTPATALQAITALVADPALRARIGGAALDHVRRHRSSAAVAPQWSAAFAQARELTRAA
jgi:glycosyltransferase involved in cell wall biosynthesis